MMNVFDKFCAIFSFILGLVLLVLGVLGLFMGCSAHFTLPPVLGALPAFVGWGIVRAVYFAWTRPQPPTWSPSAFEPPEIEPRA